MAFDGRVGEWKIDAVRAAIENGQVAQISRVRGLATGKIRRIWLKAEPGDIAHRSPTSTVEIPDYLTSTYCHRDSLAKGL